MDFTLDAQQWILVDAARAFAGEIAPDYRKPEQDRIIDPELPVELGGRGNVPLTSGLMIEEVTYGDINVSYLPLVASLVGQVVNRNATKNVRSRWYRWRGGPQPHR